MRLKKNLIIFIILFYFLIYISDISCQEILLSEKDGTDWIDSNESYKAGYIAGFITGIGVANRKFSVFSTTNAGIIFKDETEKAVFNSYWDEIGLYKITVGQIKDGIDAFYQDFSNRRIKIIDAIYVVKMYIRGESADLIDAQTRYLRMQPIASDVYSKIYFKLEEFKKKKGSMPNLDDIKNGEFSLEELLKIGWFLDSDNNYHFLFCYGTYK